MKLFEVQPTDDLQRLFNIQKARVYEYYLERYKSFRLLSVDTLNVWIRSSSQNWSSPLSPKATANEKRKFPRVYLAKKAFERAGGKYENF